MQTRKCSILSAKTGERQPATFHCWEQFSNVVGPSPMRGGHPGGAVAFVMAIVELSDGTVKKVEPTTVIFEEDKDA